MSRKANHEQEREIGRRECAFDLKRQIFSGAERGLHDLERQLALANPSQRLRIGSEISKAESRLARASEDLAQAADELREAWSWRGGAQPSIPPLETRNEPVIADESPLLRQMELEAAVERAKEDAIPYSTKLERTTSQALDQLYKTCPEPLAPEPVTFPEKIAACERKINSCKTEIDYLSEQLRPTRLAQAGSRLGELRAEKSAEIQFAEETLRAKKADLAKLIAQHKELLADARAKTLVNAAA
jgi:hypothetical protein